MFGETNTYNLNMKLVLLAVSFCLQYLKCFTAISYWYQTIRHQTLLEKMIESSPAWKTAMSIGALLAGTSRETACRRVYILFTMFVLYYTGIVEVLQIYIFVIEYPLLVVQFCRSPA